MSTPNEVQERVAELLNNSEALTAADCQRLILDVHQAQTEVGERVARTKPADARSGPGAERQAALTRGTPEDVAKVEAEHAQATTLAAQLAAQREELNRLKTAAKLREAVRDLPKMQAAITAKIEAAEAAQEALQAAMREVHSSASEIWNARGTIRQCGSEPDTGASLHVLRRLSRLDDTDWLHLIGCAVTETVYRDAEARAPGADFSQCASDAEVRRTAVEAMLGKHAVAGQSDDAVARTFATLHLRPGAVA